MSEIEDNDQWYRLITFYSLAGIGNGIMATGELILRTIHFSVIFLLVFEWYIQIHLICSQCNRSVDQILVDNYGEFVSEEEKKFQKHEDKLYDNAKIIVFLSYLLILIFAFLELVQFDDH
jgi:hypothetical protein